MLAVGDAGEAGATLADSADAATALSGQLEVDGPQRACDASLSISAACGELVVMTVASSEAASVQYLMATVVTSKRAKAISRPGG